MLLGAQASSSASGSFDVVAAYKQAAQQVRADQLLHGTRYWETRLTMQDPHPIAAIRALTELMASSTGMSADRTKLTPSDDHLGTDARPEKGPPGAH